MFLKEGNTILLLVLVANIFLLPIMVVGSTYPELVAMKIHESGEIDPDDPIYTRSITYSSIADGTESALKYMHVDQWLVHTPGNQFSYPGSIAIIDSGISVDQYHAFETSNQDGLYVDIIKYVTKDENGNILTLGAQGIDPLYNITDRLLGYDASYSIHGVETLSCIEMIARKAQIVYINDALEDPYGFEKIETRIDVWQWLYDNADTYNIRVLVMAWSLNNPSQSVLNLITKLHDEKNIYMVTSMGNDGKNSALLFPQSHEFVYAIGSIDHENRGEWVSPWSYDEDYYSVKDVYSGSSQYVIDEEANNGKPFKSDYGSSTANDPGALDFIMPGNGVPVVRHDSSDLDSFKYQKGTSFSAAFLGAIAYIVVYAYFKGFTDHGGSSSDNRAIPDAQTIHSLLLDSASLSTFSMRYGYGYVNVDLAYTNAYNMGYNLITGGGGGGGNIHPQ